MRLTLRQQALTALDVSVIALHWAAAPWERVAPGVARQIRRIADHLAAKAAALRRGEGPPDETIDDDPLDPLDAHETPTDKVKRPEDP